MLPFHPDNCHPLQSILMLYATLLVIFAIPADSSVAKRDFSPPYSYGGFDPKAQLLESNGPTKVDCPHECKCTADEYVICDDGGMTSIPINRIPRKTKVLIIDGSKEENSLTIGKIFTDLPQLTEIQIIHSKLPAIGASSFYPGKNIKSIDLSHNHLKLLDPSHFLYLENLLKLNLSHNKLISIPSNVFVYLNTLRQLSLAHNLITTIAPRMFYNLTNLENLDLSYNKLINLKSEHFIDILHLKVLHLRHCDLRDINFQIFRNLTKLVELDVQHNQLTHLISFGFTGLQSLRTLRLDGNKLTTLSDHTFETLQLRFLSLSANRLTTLKSGAFLNSIINSLDLSVNMVTDFESSLLEPLAKHLTELNISNNVHQNDPSNFVFKMIRPLHNLQQLSLSNIGLNDSIDPQTFQNCGVSLLSLDLSQNHLVNISATLFRPLIHIENLNLSNNDMYSLSSSVLDIIASQTTLRKIDLHNNPWSCYQCHVIPLIEWFNKLPKAYFNLCPYSWINDIDRLPSSPSEYHHPQASSSSYFCAKCAHPFHLSGQQVNLITDDNIQDCNEFTSFQMKLTGSPEKIELLFGILIIVVFLFLFIVLGLMYRKQGSDYYTREKGDEDEVCKLNKQQQQPVSPPPMTTIPTTTTTTATTNNTTPTANGHSMIEYDVHHRNHCNDQYTFHNDSHAAQHLNINDSFPSPPSSLTSSMISKNYVNLTSIDPHSTLTSCPNYPSTLDSSTLQPPIYNCQMQILKL
ncbi:uncharacterized protein LOC141849773 [Brevipalpus obovatus]|uniref:uncharacterized protein LOC141849773 n=1 Tax=Brevipalpus obovatus TaxID=246614 RepID=UPI003D9EF9CE